MSDRMAFKIISGMLALVFMLAFGAVRSSWTEKNTVPINTKQQSANIINKHKTESRFNLEIEKQLPSVNGQTDKEQSEDSVDHSEFWPPLFGSRFKITDSLLVLFTAVLAWKTWGLDDSTRKLWKAGEDALTATERAFVFIDSFANELSTLADAPADAAARMVGLVDPTLYVTRFAVQPRWKNSGSSPTANMTFRVDWCLGENRQVGTYRDLSAAFFVGSQAVVGSDFIEIPGLGALIQNGMGDFAAPVPLMLIWGRADYDDVFGKAHFVEWCFKVRPDRHDGKHLRVTFIPHGSYNRTDQDRRPR